MKDICKLISIMEKARANVEKALQEKYPEGSTIECTLRSGQTNPTSMEVISHNGDGYVRASMPSSRGYGLFVRDIYYRDIRSKGQTT